MQHPSFSMELSRSEYRKHWLNAFLILLFPFLMLLQSILRFQVGAFALWLVITSLLGLILHHLKSTALNYITLPFAVSPETFRLAALAAAKRLRWEILRADDDYFLALDNNNPWHRGLRIQIHREQKQLLFNAMIVPSLWSFPFSFNRIAYNERVFKSQLLAAKRGKDVLGRSEKARKRDEKYWKEPEWTLRKSLGRLLGWGLGIGLLLLFIWQLTCSGDAGGIHRCLFGIVVILTYLITDMKILLYKSRNQTNDKQ